MLFRLLTYVVQRRALAFRAALVFFLAAVVYVIASGRTYEARALLMPPVEQTSEGALSAWMTKLNLPAMVSPGTSGTTSAQILGDIIRSRRLAEMIIAELSLKQHYRVDLVDDAVKELGGRTGVSVTETGLIHLSVTDRNPEYAMKIARAYITGLDSLSRYLQYSRAEQTRTFIARQLASYRAQLEATRQEIAVFQREHDIVDFDEQVRGAIDVAADLKVRAVLAGIERDLVQEYSLGNSMELKRKNAEYENLTLQLEKLMSGDSSSAVFIPLKRLPALVQRYAGLQRDLEVGERVYSYLLERYEEAGIEKARTTPVVQVVDEPGLPEKPSGRSKWVIVVFATVVGFLWACAMIAWWGWMRGRASTSEERRALAELQSAVRGDVLWLRRKLRL